METATDKTKAAVVAHLAEIGVVVPIGVDLTSEVGLHCLLAALKTRCAAEKKQSMEAAAAGERKKDGLPVVEGDRNKGGSGGIAFDESDPSAAAKGNHVTHEEAARISAAGVQPHFGPAYPQVLDGNYRPIE